MCKNISKFLIQIFLIMSIVFIGMKRVTAEECTFAVPMTYMDENEIATLLQIDYTHEYGVFWKSTEKTITKVEKFLLKCNTSNNSCSFGFKTETPLYTNTDQDSFLSNPYYPTTKIEYNGDCSEKYLFYTIDPSEEVNGVMSTNTFATHEKMYQDRLMTLYKNKVSSENLYGLVTIQASNSNIYGSSIHKSFANYISSLDGIVLVNTNEKEKYPSSRLSKFQKELEKLEGGAEALENFPIDKNDYNEITYTDAYYNATKDKWKIYMQNDINNPKKADLTRKKYFLNWYNNVSRYIFEDDESGGLELFRKYFVYLYENDKTPLASNNASNAEESGEKNYTLIVKAIDAMLNYESAESKEDEYLNDTCSSLCVSTIVSAQASEECKKGEPYDNCVKANKKCSDKCKDIPGSTYEACYNSCMKTELGEESYNAYESAKEEREQDIENEKAEALSNIVDYLSRVDTPVFSGIEFNKEGYKLQCEDVEILHIIYNVMRIMAPILVVLFGTFDYTKSVLAADEKKILEARKKFPKRLLLLVLFILVPTIVSIIIHFAGGEPSLLRCIVKGS